MAPDHVGHVKLGQIDEAMLVHKERGQLFVLLMHSLRRRCSAWSLRTVSANVILDTSVSAAIYRCRVWLVSSSPTDSARLDSRSNGFWIVGTPMSRAETQSPAAEE
ncbi:hypothetical protein FVE85_5370 [Porphyridium purpureum]|uniref:Uncharacterized protein n=1 Tax=Porphyridium purpureum TaxID=35688 RepID=A0A5J4Z3B5_PORPP|nr:hypothetical protein FVE85_5370 [Porphyridium purpureum]|eukprot:POR8041..scf295_1